MEYTLNKLLGGIANGRDVPGDWEMISEWQEPGTENKSFYEQRAYFLGDDKFIVWTEVTIPEPVFQSIMRWHRETYRGDLVDAQKDILHESIAAATSYTNIVLVGGIAALFALWAQMNDKFTPLTSFSAAVFLSLSVLAFVGWEIFGMIIRSNVNIALAKAVNDPEQFESRIGAHRERMASLTRTLQPVWFIVVSVAAGSALVAFIIMLSAMLNAAWLALVAR